MNDPLSQDQAVSVRSVYPDPRRLGRRSWPGRPITMPNLDRFPDLVRNFLLENQAASGYFVAEEEVRTEWLRNHLFRLEANLCIDGRVTDFWEALLLPMGILEMYRSAGANSKLSNPAYVDRCDEAVLRASYINLDGIEKQMGVIRFCTVHYSFSRPTMASCAYWKNDTNAALRQMQKRSHLLHASFPAQMLAFPVMIDTDLDAITIVGPEGMIGVRELIHDEFYVSHLEKSLREEHDVGRLRRWIRDKLYRIFPSSWAPLAAFKPEFREAFHTELAECVAGNLGYVTQVIDLKRPVELLDHHERIIFVGGNGDWMVKHKDIFLIDDTDADEEVDKNFEIALKYVTLNTVIAAIKEGKRDWSVPVIVNIPHTGKNDACRRVYASLLVEQRLRPKVEAYAGEVVRWLFEHGGLQEKMIPGWMQVQLPLLPQHVQFYCSTSYRGDRLFVPFDYKEVLG